MFRWRSWVTVEGEIWAWAGALIKVANTHIPLTRQDTLENKAFQKDATDR